MRYGSVIIEGERLIKRQSPERSRVERERSQFGARVSSSCGDFSVPDVLSYDDDAGEIVFRFVPKAVPLKTYLIKRPTPELLERTGHALACIHTACSDSEETNVYWHGDFGMGNLLYTESRDELTIVDWNNAHWSLEPPERSRGPAGLDLGIAILSLFHHIIVHPIRIPQPECLSSALLTGYQRVRTSFRINEERSFLTMVCRRWYRYHLHRHGVLRTLAAIPSWGRINRFLSTVELER